MDLLDIPMYLKIYARKISFKISKCSFSLKLYCMAIFIIIFVLIYLSGLLAHFYEDDFRDFKYPYEGNVEEYVIQLRQHKKPSKPTINHYNYKYVTDCSHKCNSNSSLRLVYLVKSAMNNFNQRLVIRNTWGYEKRFSDVEIRTIFLLGVSNNTKLQAEINEEYLQFKDIVQANFTDAYYNNTIKTMIGFKWAVTKCPNSKFYMFCDDDYYISTKNLLRYVRHPTKYPEYLTDSDVSLNNVLLRRARRQFADFDLPDGIRFYSGFVREESPFRNIFSKWYVSLEEYQYNIYPLYATAGAYILSKDALIDMYYTSFYTKHFVFDDVYLGILAHKIGILPYHSSQFYLYRPKYSIETYKYLIASHGFENVDYLMKVWNEQREFGNA